MKRFTLFLLILNILLASALAVIQKPVAHRNLELISDRILKSELKGNMRVEIRTGIPRAIYSPRFPVRLGDPESMARQYLETHSELLHLQQGTEDLKYLRTVETPAGHRVQFVQTRDDHPVYKASLKVSINHQNQVVFVTNGYQKLNQISNQLKLPESLALSLAREHLQLSGKGTFEKVELIVYPQAFQQGLLTYQVIIVPGGESYGDWEILVDAETGAIVRAEDKACYHNALRESGSGWVFDPDPITHAQTVYGQAQFSNGGDADTDSLTAQLAEVLLEDISFAGGMYQLVGPYASIIDIEAPYTGSHEQDSSNFHFTRSQTGFEAVNTYYHIHNTMKYLNETLGFEVMPFQYEGGVHFDPRALNGDANAYYTGSTGWVAFGVPANSVDAAEDHAIILHEIGHGIHDWITVGGLSQVEGLSEGLGDYWAQSYTRSLGYFDPGDDQYDYFGMWGLQPFGGPSLRVTNFPNHYPEGLGGEVHYDGQLWASTLMSVWDAIGRTATDTDCWEAISMTDGNTNQMDAAFAFLQADMDTYGGANISGIMPAFIDRGYLPGPVVARFEADVTGGPSPLTVNFVDHSFVQQPPISSWAWDFNNDGIIDSDEQNPSFTFTEPGLYSVSLTISDGLNEHTLTEDKFVSVNAGVLVFDGQEPAWNVVDYSGEFMAEQFMDMGIPVNYSNRLWSSLRGYDAVFVSLGNLGYEGDAGTFMSDKDLNSIVEYVTNGGRLYIEGGSLMGGAAAFGNPDYQAFWELFGIQSAHFNYSEHPLTGLIGQVSSVAEGLNFAASTQVNNWYIDDVTANPDGTIVFNEPGFGNIAIQGAGSHGQRTVYMAYALAGLVDGDLQNTRRQLLIRILEFFGTPLLAPAFSASVNSGHAPLSVEFADVSGSNPDVISWAWDFDADGITDSESSNPSWIFEIPGNYDIGLTVSNGDTTRSIQVVNAIRVFDGETALQFHNNDQLVVVAQQPSINAIFGLSVEAWIKPLAWGDENGGDGRIVDKGYYRLFLNKAGSTTYPDSTLCVIIKHEDGTLSKASAQARDIDLNIWQHIAVTYDGFDSELHIYINGVDRTLIHTAPTSIIKDNAEKDLIIGNNSSLSKGFEGLIDELRIWDSARSPEDLVANMTGTLSGDQSELQAYYSMNEAYGHSLTDLSTHDNQGEIISATWEFGTDFVVPVALASEPILPHGALLIASYPNPFNASTSISYHLPNQGWVTLSIYNIRGELVKTLVSAEQAGGWHELTWQADHQDGSAAATGFYFCSLKSSADTRTQKMLLLK